MPLLWNTSLLGRNSPNACRGRMEGQVKEGSSKTHDMFNQWHGGSGATKSTQHNQDWSKRARKDGSRHHIHPRRRRTFHRRDALETSAPPRESVPGTPE